MAEVVEVTLSALSRPAIALEQVGTAVVVAALDHADAAAAHLAVGDVVVSINGEHPSIDCHDAAAPGDDPVVLVMRVRRAGAPEVAPPPLQEVQEPSSSYGGTFGGYGLEPGLFSMPCNMLPLADGTGLIVADGGGCRLQIVEPDGALRFVRAERGDAAGQVNYPAGLATDGDTVCA